MVHQKAHLKQVEDVAAIGILETMPLWQLDIIELLGHNLKARGWEEVNRLLEEEASIASLSFHEKAG